MNYNDDFYDSICAPQFYDFLNEEIEDKRDKWFATHNEEFNDNDFKETILPTNEFDFKTPPKIRSPIIPKYKELIKENAKHLAAIPLPSFMLLAKTKQIEVEEEDEELSNEDNSNNNVKEISPQVKSYFNDKKKPKKRHSTLTIPVSPFFRTNMRAKRNFVDKHSKIPKKVLRPKNKIVMKLTEPQEFSFSTLKRSVIRNTQKKTQIKKKNTTTINNNNIKSNDIKKWKAKITQPQEFHFHTSDRQNIRNNNNNIHKNISHNDIKNTNNHSKEQIILKNKKSQKLKLTEPQSPFLHTKQRSSIKRIHSDTNLKPNDLYKQQSHKTNDNTFATFDRENNIKKPHRNSLTEPKPFHFHTHDRSIIRGNSRSSIDIPNQLPIKKPWKSTLTEPKAFHFHTEDRANQRSQSSLVVVNDSFDSFNSKIKHKRKSTLTEPKPFHFQTEQRSLQRIEQNKLKSQQLQKYQKKKPFLTTNQSKSTCQMSNKINKKIRAKSLYPTTKHERKKATIIARKNSGSLTSLRNGRGL